MVQAHSIAARYELRRIEAYLQWDGLSAEQKQKLAVGRVLNLETYKEMFATVRPPKGKGLIDWTGECGLGIVDTVGDFVRILEIRLAEQLFKDFNAKMEAAEIDTLLKDIVALGGKKFQNVYRTIPLSFDAAHLLSPYNFDSLEGRIWLDAALRSPGLEKGQQISYHLAA